MIEAKNLTKRFGTLTAVNDVSFSVAVGDVVGFLGANGAGKSTTMRLLTGFFDADAGSVRIGGHDMATARREGQACLGYLPEAAAGFPNLTVREFLAFCGESRNLFGRELQAAVDGVCSLIDLEAALDKPMKSLSKGWRQRAWLGQAILHDPPVLILDEPTDGLDPIQKEQVRALIRSVASKKAIILSTHILEEAEEICTRAVIIADGRIVADDTPGNLADDKGRIANSFRRLAGTAP
ncbi:MAG: ABC transporter ATP-binding protein [Proteobacteria bacterium]|nr:ABC transporter ATP-binding protein [Pseudomonadota bacterium]MDA1022784.1 ABC transporter ATP-binding protein [Pseudomonadota bacterium]